MSIPGYCLRPQTESHSESLAAYYFLVSCAAGASGRGMDKCGTGAGEEEQQVAGLLHQLDSGLTTGLPVLLLICSGNTSNHIPAPQHQPQAYPRYCSTTVVICLFMFLLLMSRHIPIHIPVAQHPSRPIHVSTSQL